MKPDEDNDRPFPQPTDDGATTPGPEQGSPVPDNDELDEIDEELAEEEAEDSNDENGNDLAPDTNVSPGS